MILENIAEAFKVLATVDTIILMMVGVAGGLIAGAIPGFTIAMAVVLTLPFTFGMPPAQGLATMVSVLVGGLSGGLMAGIMTGIPGTPSSQGTANCTSSNPSYRSPTDDVRPCARSWPPWGGRPRQSTSRQPTASPSS